MATRRGLNTILLPMGEEMVRHIAFPFPGNRFPDNLGAVVQRTVLDGDEPSRYVGHTPDNSWVISDGVNDPNEPGACVAVHVRHVIDRDPSLEALANLPIGFEAERDSPGDEWTIRPFSWTDE
jgi:hypothetical protein